MTGALSARSPRPLPLPLPVEERAVVFELDPVRSGAVPGAPADFPRHALVAGPRRRAGVEVAVGARVERASRVPRLLGLRDGGGGLLRVGPTQVPVVRPLRHRVGSGTDVLLLGDARCVAIRPRVGDGLVARQGDGALLAIGGRAVRVPGDGAVGHDGSLGGSTVLHVRFSSAPRWAHSSWSEQTAERIHAVRGGALAGLDAEYGGVRGEICSRGGV